VILIVLIIRPVLLHGHYELDVVIWGLEMDLDLGEYNFVVAKMFPELISPYIARVLIEKSKMQSHLERSCWLEELRITCVTLYN